MTVKPIRTLFAASALFIAGTMFASSPNAASVHPDQKRRESVLKAMTDPASGVEEIQSALTGGSLDMGYGRPRFDEHSAKYIFDARRDILRSLDRPATAEESERMLTYMSVKAESWRRILAFSAIFGVAGIVMLRSFGYLRTSTARGYTYTDQDFKYEGGFLHKTGKVVRGVYAASVLATIGAAILRVPSGASSKASVAEQLAEQQKSAQAASPQEPKPQ